MSQSEKPCQLYQYCDQNLGNAILKGNSDVVNWSEQECLSIIKQLADIPVSIFVQHSDFLSTRQDLTKIADYLLLIMQIIISIPLNTKVHISYFYLTKLCKFEIFFYVK